MRFKNFEGKPKRESPSLKTLRGSPKGKVQREQYRLAVGLDGYIFSWSQIVNSFPLSKYACEAVDSRLLNIPLPWWLICFLHSRTHHSLKINWVLGASIFIWSSRTMFEVIVSYFRKYASPSKETLIVSCYQNFVPFPHHSSNLSNAEMQALRNRWRQEGEGNFSFLDPSSVFIFCHFFFVRSVMEILQHYSVLFMN